MIVESSSALVSINGNVADYLDGFLDLHAFAASPVGAIVVPDTDHQGVLQECKKRNIFFLESNAVLHESLPEVFAIVVEESRLASLLSFLNKVKYGVYKSKIKKVLLIMNEVQYEKFPVQEIITSVCKK